MKASLLLLSPLLHGSSKPTYKYTARRLVARAPSLPLSLYDSTPLSLPPPPCVSVSGWLGTRRSCRVFSFLYFITTLRLPHSSPPEKSSSRLAARAHGVSHLAFGGKTTLPRETEVTVAAADSLRSDRAAGPASWTLRTTIHGSTSPSLTTVSPPPRSKPTSPRTRIHLLQSRCSSCSSVRPSRFPCTTMSVFTRWC